MTSYAEALDAYTKWHASLEKLAPSSLWVDLMGVPTGWRPLMEDFARDVESSGVPIEVAQAKVKGGGLRIYYGTRDTHNRAHPRIEALVDATEDRASATCEMCGGPGVYRGLSGFARVLCDGCATDDGMNGGNL